MAAGYPDHPRHDPPASRGLTSEIVAGVCKLMSNLDLIYAAKKMRVTAHCNTTIGLPGTFSSRLQPNHTTDDPNGIIASRDGGPVPWAAATPSSA